VADSRVILIVDAHAPSRRWIRALLDAERQEGYVIEEASSGTECLLLAETRGPFSLVLLDVALPDVDGLTVCRALHRDHPETPVVLLSAGADRRAMSEGLAAGGDSYLLKPISRAALLAVARLFSHLHRQREAVGTRTLSLSGPSRSLR
jgi:two-component system, OmpR family, lantibiotic biosynthesis response regulator NisR/SpaR